MRSKGFTLIELLAVIVILAVIALIATPIILGIISDSKKQVFKDSTYGIIDAAKYNYVETMYSSETPVDITFTYEGGEESSSVEGKVLNYEGAKPQSGVVSLTSNGNVAIALYDGTYCAYKSFSDIDVIVENIPLVDCSYEYSVSKGVNVPKLAKGMTPIKWNGSQWIETNVTDSDWYSYDATNRKWANAKTVDGSMWVWIPRYVYKITSNWHTQNVGIIEIQFSKGTKDDWNSSITLNTDTTSNASNNTWTNHPGFTFGGTELTGIWVAKFEPSVADQSDLCYTSSSSTNCNKTTLLPKIIPNVYSWRNIKIGTAFTAIRNMEASSVYGWNIASDLQANGTFTIDGNGVDTHLMKNAEWGILTYLSKSQYGKNTEKIWINNANDFTTGCSGVSVSDPASTTGCVNAYSTAGGQKASTTGSIYGIYDISGGASEYLATYLDNGHMYLNNGSSIVSASSIYKDAYSVTEDNQATNYSNSINIKGIALYETSGPECTSSGNKSWFGDRCNMAYTTYPWFIRGGIYYSTTDAGTFTFSGGDGFAYSTNTFRPVLIVAPNL